MEPEHMPTIVRADELSALSIFIFRPDRSEIHISGINLTFNVDAGVLLILSNGHPAYAFSPGQWLTVNTAPV